MHGLLHVYSCGRVQTGFGFSSEEVHAADQVVLTGGSQNPVWSIEPW